MEETRGRFLSFVIGSCRPGSLEDVIKGKKIELVLMEPFPRAGVM
jgi:hypothetical protein